MGNGQEKMVTTPGNGTSLPTKAVIGSLIAAFVLGGVKLAVGQGSTDKQVETNTEEIARQRKQSELVPVIQNDITTIKQRIEKIDGRLEASAATQQEILRRLPARVGN